MLIRCDKCNKQYDLNTRFIIEGFINGIPFKCNCGNEIYYKWIKEDLIDDEFKK